MRHPTPAVSSPTLLAPLREQDREILTPAALQFLGELHGNFESRRAELLRRREVRQLALDGGELPDFLAETRAMR